MFGCGLAIGRSGRHDYNVAVPVDGAKHQKLALGKEKELLPGGRSSFMEPNYGLRSRQPVTFGLELLSSIGIGKFTSGP